MEAFIRIPMALVLPRLRRERCEHPRVEQLESVYEGLINGSLFVQGHLHRQQQYRELQGMRLRSVRETFIWSLISCQGQRREPGLHQHLP